MTPKQLFNYYKDKRDVSCELTNELIQGGFVQKIGGEVDEEENEDGNVKTYYIVCKNEKDKYESNYIDVAEISDLPTPPSQWWHLMQYCLAQFEKEMEDVGCKFSCGELIFWMAEATLSDSSLSASEKFSIEELEKLKNDVIDIKNKRGKANKLIKDVCLERIKKIVEKTAE